MSDYFFYDNEHPSNLKHAQLRNVIFQYVILKENIVLESFTMMKTYFKPEKKTAFILNC